MSARCVCSTANGSLVHFLALAGGLALIAVVLREAFETIILPRTVTRRLRVARLYFRSIWHVWSRMARAITSDRRRERFLSIYGPASLLGLLTLWAVSLIFAFAVLQWSAGSRLRMPH